MAAVEENFDYWLSLKLKDLNADESVFSAYIKGILEGEDPEDEKREALESILCGITPDIATHCQEILEKWLSSSNSAAPVGITQPMEQLDNVDERLARLLETNVKSSSVQRSYTEEERKIRDAILSQYGQTSDYEDEYDEDEVSENKSKNKSKENGLEKNMNSLSIHLADKEKREYLKEESRKKKEKDKEDREKQKQLVQEKKDKRKSHAQKGERRR